MGSDRKPYAVEVVRLSGQFDNGQPARWLAASWRDGDVFVAVIAGAGRSGYDGHSILVTGYNDDEVIIQNPDSDNGNQPNQHVSWQVLNEAWKAFGGSYSLHAFKGPDTPQ